MGMRNLLLVHGSGTIRNRLKSYILSELDDIAISEVSSSQEAIQKCREQKFELVLCGKELSDLNGLALFKKIQTPPINKEVAFILVTSTNTTENIKELLAEYNSVQVSSLPCRFLRLNVLTWKPDGTPERVHAAWGILGLSIQEKKIMEQIFEESKERA